MKSKAQRNDIAKKGRCVYLSKHFLDFTSITLAVSSCATITVVDYINLQLTNSNFKQRALAYLENENIRIDQLKE